MTRLNTSAERVSNFLWKVIPIVIALASVVTPIWTTLNVYDRGPTPEKHVELTRIVALDPMHDLSSLYDSATLQLKFKDQTIDNIIITSGIFLNSGSAPITPSDYVEKLSVNVLSPWKIVAVKNQASYVHFEWKRVSDQRFEADPGLLNPGDRTWAVVYVTNTKYTPPQPGVFQRPIVPDISWQARIINLKAFYEPPGLIEKYQSRNKFITVQLGGWSLGFTVITALLFLAVYLHLLMRAGFQKIDWMTISLIVASSMLSFSAAEALATYLYGNVITDLAGVNHWLNAPPIILHVVVVVVLYYTKPKNHQKPRKVTSHVGISPKGG